MERDSLTGSVATGKPWRLGDAALGTPYKGSLDDLRFYGRALSGEEVLALNDREPARAGLLIGEKKRSKDQKERVRDYYMRFAAPDDLRAAWSEYHRLKAIGDELEYEVLNVMVMQDMPWPRDTYVLGRGDYQNRKEKVTAATPAVLPPLPKDKPREPPDPGRVVGGPGESADRPRGRESLLAMYFGTGIVKTVEDFGSQGEPPSHPELLDWLATEFVRTGWDVKAMQRLIVISATYRQSSRITPEMKERDPENRLLARGPRFRLPAEMVRDNALAVSGLIDNRIGGPSVYPYQPPGLWEEVAYGGVFSAQKYGEEPWPRSVPPQHVHVLEANRAAPVPGDLRCPEPREVRRAPVSDEYTLAGAGTAE